MFYEKYEIEVNGKWVETFYTEEPAQVYSALAHVFRAKYLDKCNWVKRITRKYNHKDSTETITVLEYSDNLVHKGRRTFRVPR